MLDTLTVLVVGNPAAPTIRLSGDADLATVGQLIQALQDCSGHVLLDCAELSFCDVTALNTVLTAASRLRAGGGSLTLSRPPASLRIAIAALGVDHLLG